MEAKEIAAKVLARVDLKGLLIEDVLKGVVKKKLEEIVADSANTFDDAMFAMVYPLLEKAVVDWLDAELAKLK